MSPVLELRAGDWAGSRFVRARLWEVHHAVGLLTHPRRQRHHRAWLETIDTRAALARTPVLSALNPDRGWVPDFLVPPPTADRRTLDAELALVAATPLDVVVEDVGRTVASRPSQSRRAVLEPLLADPARLLAAVVDELGWAWESLLAPFWAPVERLLDADISYRSRVMTRSGLGRVIDGLHPQVVRDGDRVAVSGGDEVDIDVGGAGLALMPSAFIWPLVVAVHGAPGWPVAIVYPARGMAELWSRPPVPVSALVDVLGHTRALLLVDLAAPATTTALARRHDLSLATVSTQLTRLRDARLTTAERIGKEVHYRRTPLGDALVRSAAWRP